MSDVNSIEVFLDTAQATDSIVIAMPTPMTLDVLRIGFSQVVVDPMSQTCRLSGLNIEASLLVLCLLRQIQYR